MAAPIMDDLPIWMSPCGEATPINGMKDSINSTKLEGLLGSILSHTSSALEEARVMTEKYVSTTISLCKKKLIPRTPSTN
jgi:hypothetical protein